MRGEKGFTLIELMIAVFVAGVVMTAVYSAYSSQQRAYTTQEGIAAMQANLRAAMYFMSKEIRMAGCNPEHESGVGGFETIQANTIRFTMDLRGQGPNTPPDGDDLDVDEDVTYFLGDWNGDLISDLMRSTPQAPNEPVAENIDALDFVYLDGNGNIAPDRLSVRSVQVTLVGRSTTPDPDFTDTTNYTNMQGTIILPAPNDNFRRRALSTHINSRNMGF